MDGYADLIMALASIFAAGSEVVVIPNRHASWWQWNMDVIKVC